MRGLAKPGRTLGLHLSLLAGLFAALLLWAFPLRAAFIEDVESGHLLFARMVADPGQAPDLGYLYFWLAFRLWGDDPLGYHLVNALLHLANALLLLGLAARLTRSRTTGLLAAALFLAHPNIAPVVFITKRTEDLAAVALALAATLLHLRFAASGRRRWCWGALGLFLAGLLFRTSIILFPLIFLAISLLYDERPGPGARRRAVLGLWPYAALPALAGAGLLALRGVRPDLSIFSSDALATFAERAGCFANSVGPRVLSVADFLKYNLLPVDLELLSPGFCHHLGQTPRVSSALILAALALLLLLLRGRAPRLLLVWLLVTPIPYLFHRFPCEGADVKEKYLYLHLAGCCMLAGWLLRETGRRLQARRPGPGMGWHGWLALALLLPMTLSTAARGRQRAEAGRVVQQGRRAVARALLRPSSPLLVYMVLPNELWRYQAFTGTGDLVKAALPRRWLAMALGRRIRRWTLPPVSRGEAVVRHYTLELEGEDSTADLLLYRYLGLAVGAPRADLCQAAAGDIEVERQPGVDSLVPSCFARRVFAMGTLPGPGIREVTRQVYPLVQVKLRLRCPPEVTGLQLWTLLTGSAVPAGRATLTRDGPWCTGQLELQPGLYPYMLVSSDGQRYTLRGFGGVLPVVNPALPVGLSDLEGTELHRRVLLHKEQVLLRPREPAVHRELARLLELGGLFDAARMERALAKRLEGMHP